MKKTKNQFNDIYFIIKENPHLINLYIGFLDSVEIKYILENVPQTKIYLE
jgi:hypothetical protein